MFRHVPVVLFLLAAPAAALASPMTITSTGVEGSDGNTYAYVGSDYQTTGVDLSQNGGKFTLSFTTAFSGTDNVAGYNIAYADVFLNNGVAISLGDQGANGGVSAGVYQVGSYETSQQIWGGRSGVIYGEGYYNGGPAQLSPTVLTSGTRLEGISVSDTNLGNGFYDLAITFADLAAFNSATGLFWGTGDCANGGTYAVGNFDVPVPEPATFGLVAMGLIGLTVLRRSPVARPGA